MWVRLTIIHVLLAWKKVTLFLVHNAPGSNLNCKHYSWSSREIEMYSFLTILHFNNKSRCVDSVPSNFLFYSRFVNESEWHWGLKRLEPFFCLQECVPYHWCLSSCWYFSVSCFLFQNGMYTVSMTAVLLFLSKCFQCDFSKTFSALICSRLHLVSSPRRELDL